MAEPERQTLGVRLIILYKAMKAVAEVALSIGLVVLAATGEIATFREVAFQLKENLASRWSLIVGHALAGLVSERGIHLLEIGFALDGIVSVVEGWSLWRGYRWGLWLVVAATATPLPLEVVAIVHAHRPSRVVLALLNVLIVFYMARHIRHDRPRPAISEMKEPPP